MIGCRDSYRLNINMKNLTNLNVGSVKVRGNVCSMKVGYEINQKTGISFLYGTLLEVESQSKDKNTVTFKYAPAKYKEPTIFGLKVNGIKYDITEDQTAIYKKIIVAMIDTIDKDVMADIKTVNPINTRPNTNNGITPIEGLDINMPQEESAPVVQDNKDEVIKKLLEENAKLTEENKKLKALLNKKSEAKEETAATITESFNADKLMETMRKEFDKKLESLRKEMMDKLNDNNTTVVTKVEEPVIETIKEDKPKTLTAEELLATKELEDMSFQELQRVGKHFKIGAANNSPRPQLIETLKQYVNPETIITEEDDIPELLEETVTDEIVVDTTTVEETADTSNLSDLQRELLADLQACL